jgi:hypothetical protein
MDNQKICSVRPLGHEVLVVQHTITDHAVVYMHLSWIAIATTIRSVIVHEYDIASSTMSCTLMSAAGVHMMYGSMQKCNSFLCQALSTPAAWAQVVIPENAPVM